MGALIAIGATRVYLDANIFIYWLEDDPSFGDRVAEVFGAIQRNQLQSVTSELTLAEVLVKPFADRNTARQRAYERILSAASPVQIAPIDRAVLTEAARLRAATRLPLADAIHIATAQLTGCGCFLSNDRRLANLSPLRVVSLRQLAVES